MKSKKVSAVIPTYNGLKLLKKNIPFVLSSLGNNDELLIVDDSSTDKTVDWIIKEFSCKKITNDKQIDVIRYQGSFSKKSKNILVSLVVNKKNYRFAESCNRGVYFSKGDFIFLLNNDVSPKKDSLKHLLSSFDDSVFAIGCHEKEKSLGSIDGGKNKLWFEKGLFQHSRGDNYKTGETAWVSGGSGLFDKKKWLKIGGFDESYAPAYWEDIDLSFRAKQKDWKVLFEEKSLVDHNHESTNKNEFGQHNLEKISLKNGNKFAFKNGNIFQKLQFILWQPYWILQKSKIELSILRKSPTRFLKRNWLLASFLLIIILASFLRLYKLAEVPRGMTWDEAAIGYNGYAVLNTRRDEWLNRFPISFMSFGDYKAPLAIYINGFFTFLFGMNLWAVRIPFVIASILSIIGMIKLTNILLRPYFDEKASQQLSLISGLLLTLSPWHLHFSRAGFESAMSMSFMVWGVYYLFVFKNFLNKNTISKIIAKNRFQMKLFTKGFLAISLLMASIYTYHSAKIIVPLLILFLFITNIKKGLSNIGSIFVAIWGILISLPLIYDSFWGDGLTRSGTLIFSQDLPLLKLAETIITNFLSHFSFDFLIKGATTTLRHGSGNWGVFFPTTLILILAGLFFTLLKNKSKKLSLFLIFWVIIGILPSAIGQEVPHSNRALLSLPAFLLLATLGLKYSYDYICNLKKCAYITMFTGVVIMIHLLLFISYQHHYYNVFSYESADDYKEGYLEAFEIAQEYEKGLNGKPMLNKILFTSEYGQPYIYAIFVRKTNPIWYQGGSLIKYEFKDNIDIGDLSRTDTLIVAGKDNDLPEKSADHIIYSSGGEIRFKIYVKD